MSALIVNSNVIYTLKRDGTAQKIDLRFKKMRQLASDGIVLSNTDASDWSYLREDGVVALLPPKLVWLHLIFE